MTIAGSGNIYNYVSAEVGSSYTPVAGHWVSVVSGKLAAAIDTSQAAANVVGLILVANSDKSGIIAGVGSRVPLRYLGSLASLQALSTQSGFLGHTAGSFGDITTVAGRYVRQLFTISKPIGLLVTADLADQYVTIESGIPYPLPGS